MVMNLTRGAGSCVAQFSSLAPRTLSLPASHYFGKLPGTTTGGYVQNRYYAATDLADVEERVMATLKAFDLIKSEVKIDSHFQNDLGLDSLDMVELTMKVEDEFGFEIPDKDAERFLTPADIVKYICE